MIYLKTEYKGKQIEVEIYGDDLFTRCYKCGKEFQVDEDLLRWILSDGFDLCSTSVGCGCNTEKPQLIRIK